MNGAGRFAVRAALLGLAFVHTFPARKHLVLLFERPTLDEVWKGLGAAIAVGLYLLPLKTYVRVLGVVWSRWRVALVVAGWTLAVVHAVPAADHLPKLVAHPSWGDAWRGIGATLACAWFLAPLRLQAMALRVVRPDVFVASGEVWMDRAKVAVIVIVGIVMGGALGARAVKSARTPSARNGRPAATVAERPSPSAVSVRELHVPHAAAAIEPNGDVDEPVWASAARTEAFVSNGSPARPYSDARFLWREGLLYVALYAGDEDIRATAATHDGPLWLADSFQLSFTSGANEHVIDVSPLGVVTDGVRAQDGGVDYFWESEARVGHEADGTVNISEDDDEEWVIEMAIPLASFGLTGTEGERLGISVRRCDETRQIGRTCATWGEKGAAVLVLDK